MPSRDGVRIGFLLDAVSLGSATPRLSPLMEEIVLRLKERDALVDLIVPESGPLDMAEVRPQHDLYVLKSESPLALSLAGALTVAGATVVNTFCSCNLTRDKVAAA